ncbi:hypothetical protein AB0N73_04055 [Microbacterium sp. NPDC089189]|uniref:hypothetical protein n=1 Tax=Microbacterium sp. NPDC089189 TaxID=3154972 RepID=UPI0034495D1C
MSIQDAIKRAKARQPETFVVDVQIGDEASSIVLTEVAGSEWNDLVAYCPARPHNVEDAKCGFDPGALLRRYPVDHVTIDGQLPSSEEWLDVLALLPASSFADLGVALWGLHELEPRKRLLAAVKKKESAVHG